MRLIVELDDGSCFVWKQGDERIEILTGILEEEPVADFDVKDQGPHTAEYRETTLTDVATAIESYLQNERRASIHRGRALGEIRFKK